MVGRICQVDARNSWALVDVPGCSQLAVAPFSEVVNSKPRRLDLEEVVSCTVRRRNDRTLLATEVQILVGCDERKALERIAAMLNRSLARREDRDSRYGRR